MRSIATALLVALLLISHQVGVAPTGAQAVEQIGGPDADVDCDNFLSTTDADAVFVAAGGLQGTDTYDLDGEGDEENLKACDSDGAIVDNPVRAKCSNFKERAHAQALFQAGGADDPYGLDPNRNDVPCDGGTAASNPSDLPPASSAPATAPVATGCDVQVQASRAYVNTDCADGTVDAGFLPFEGFETFAERAQNGFGAFGGSTSAAVQPVEVRQTSTLGGGNQRSGDRSNGGESRLVESEQRTQKQVRAKKKRKRLRKATRFEQQRKARLEQLRQRQRD